MELNPLYRLYVELNTKVESLIKNGVPSTNTGDVSDIIVRLKMLESKPSYDTIINELTLNIKKLQLENEELRKKVEQLSKVDNLEARIYNIEVEPKVNILPLEERLSRIENDNLKEHLVNLEGKIGNMEQLVNAITDITYRLNEIEKRPDLIQRLNALEMTMSNLNLNQAPN